MELTKVYETDEQSGSATMSETDGYEAALTAVTFAWLALTSALPLTGGRALPCAEELPRLELKCTFTVKNRSPDAVCHAAARGLRASSQASCMGSIRPGL